MQTSQINLGPEDFKRIRKNLKLTQKDIAQVLKKNKLTISHWESGNRSPSEIVKKLYQLFDTLPVDDVENLIGVLNT